LRQRALGGWAAAGLLLAEGSWPFWNPHDAFGAPFFADPNFQLRHTPVYPLLLQLPVFGLFRSPTKYLLPASLFFSLLACRGADAWLQEPRLREGRRAVAVASVSLLAGLLALAAPSGLGSPAGWLDRLIEHHAAAAGAAVVLAARRRGEC